MPWQAVELLTFRLRATTPQAPFELPEDRAPATRTRRPRSSAGAPAGSTGDDVDTPVYDGEMLLAGNVFPGPAIIEETTTTVVIPRRYRLLGGQVQELRADAAPGLGGQTMNKPNIDPITVATVWHRSRPSAGRCATSSTARRRTT